MTATHLCRCGHQKIAHRWSDDSGPHYCKGLSRIHEAHPDYEDCACTEYRPRPEPQGRML